MQADELLVVRLGKGASIVRCLDRTESHVRVALGRNRQARIPIDRVLLETALAVASEEDAEEFRRRCQALSDDIDLTEVWDVATDEAVPLGLAELAELYWITPPGMVQMAALALHLDASSDYFERTDDGYVPRTRASVEETRTRRRRQAENALEADSLVGELSRGGLPQPLSQHQELLLRHLLGYAVYGEDYARAPAARSLLERAAHGAGDLQRRSFDLLVAAGVFSPDEPLELHRADIREEFAADALAEAVALVEGARLPVDPGRRDLTGLPVITIDDADAVDRDDALSLEVEAMGPDGAPPGYRMGIHIADVGSLIPPGGAIDREADRRMATLYMPERTISMLPEVFSRRMGSLDPEEARFAVSLLVRVDAAGEVSDWEITPSVIRSRAALSYDDVDRALEDETSPWHEMLKPLRRAAQAWRRKREAAGAISVDNAEMSVKVRSPDDVEVRVVQRATPARQLVADLMILCNSLLAELCKREGLPAAYRSQAAPDLTGLESGSLTGVQGQALSGVEGALQRYLLMRRLPAAGLDVKPASHAGLGVPAYLQATSPLRRYPDLVMQRQVSHFLSTGKPLYPAESVASVIQRAAVQLREVGRLEEDRKRYWFLKYLMQTRLEGAGPAGGPDLFAATVLENHPGRRALLELAEYPFRLRAEVSLQTGPGEVVTLKLEEVDLWRRIPKFVQVRDAE